MRSAADYGRGLVSRFCAVLLVLLVIVGSPGAAAKAGPDPEKSSAAAAEGAAQEEATAAIRLTDVGPADWSGRARSALGLLVMIGLAWLLSRSRRHVSWRLVVTGILLQIALGVLTLTPPGQWFFGGFNDVVKQLLSYTTEGAGFLFGDLARYNSLPVGTSVVPGPPGGAGANDAWVEAARMAPVAVPADGQWRFVSVGAYVAFGVLPTIIFFSSLLAVLYHLGVMQAVVRGAAFIMRRTMGTSGAETLSAAGNIFVGQTEAPLLIRPFIADMTESELMAVMTGGFATVAGGVMVAYVGLLQGVFPEIAGHLLTASIMSAPAALVVAKVIIPEPDPSVSKTYGDVKVDLKSTDANVIDAAARGAGEGLQLALNVGAMLLAFVALVAMLNGLIGWVGGLAGAPHTTLEGLLGFFLRPFAWLMGVSWADAQIVGSLLGVKTVLNEFYAYVLLAEQATQLEKRSLVISAYALCGFANFSSIAIQIGGISPMAPDRRSDLARIGLRAMIGGTLAAFMTACVVGMLT